MTEPYLLDKFRRPILPNDLVKVFHFTGSRRKKYFMYKYVEPKIENIRDQAYYRFNHLDSTDKDSYYLVALDNQVQPNFEIVQGYGGDGTHFEDRKKIL